MQYNILSYKHLFHNKLYYVIHRYHCPFCYSIFETGTGELLEPVLKMSSFDKMHKELHKFAAAPNHNVEKKKYEIGVSMERGTGGLRDTDRTLLADIYSSVDSVFEFGLGESTKIAAWVGVSRYVGVDSDAAWVTNIRDEVNMDHFRFIFADIGARICWPPNE